jgi:hypothetical protein
MSDKKLFRSSTKLKAVKMVDHNHLNNGGHDEFIIFKFGKYKSRNPKYCVVEHDIYGKAKSYILTEDEVIEQFGAETLENL